MADIKWAAERLLNGESVRRNGWAAKYGTIGGTWKIQIDHSGTSRPEENAYFSPYDLIAQDWEHAE